MIIDLDLEWNSKSGCWFNIFYFKVDKFSPEYSLVTKADAFQIYHILCPKYMTKSTLEVNINRIGVLINMLSSHHNMYNIVSTSPIITRRAK